MTAEEDAIRARRKATNRLIADKAATRLAPFFADDAVVLVGEGEPLIGADAILAAFAAQFADRSFTGYERRPETVEVAGDAAAETGRWVGFWLGRPGLSGRYLASWRKRRGQWVIVQELYVTLAG
jgi:uncharacterized protein (TIGR02246 family)